jgi:hypothetical protein
MPCSQDAYLKVVHIPGRNSTLRIGRRYYATQYISSLCIHSIRKLEKRIAENLQF